MEAVKLCTDEEGFFTATRRGKHKWHGLILMV
jgi:hypothetical protein